MTFSNFKQVLVMTLAWGACLYGVDLVERPRGIRDLFASTSASAAVAHERPHLSLWLNHLCCTGCLADVRSALAPLTWLGPVTTGPDEPPLLARELADAAPGEGLHATHVELDVLDVAAADLVQLDEALHRRGLAAEHIEWSGLAHFRLEATLPHLCCARCARSLADGMSLARALRGVGQFTWLDSVEVRSDKKTIVAFARLGATVDVEEFLLALNHLGFAPASLRIRGGPET